MRATVIKLVLAISLLVILLVVGNRHVQWQSSLLHTLPQDTNPLHQAYQNSQQPNEQQFLLWLHIPAEQSESLVAHLRKRVLPQLAAEQPAIKPNEQLAIESLISFYQAHAGSFGPTAAYDQLANQPEQLITAAQQRLQQPSPIWVDLQHDPLLLTQSYVEQLPDMLVGFHYEAPLYLRSGQQNNEILLVLTSGADALSQTEAQRVVERVELQLQGIQQQFPAVELARSGFIFHAAAAANQAKHEMSLFGGLSMLFVLIMLVGVFRSLRHLAFTLFVLTTASAAGFSAVFWLFDSPHVLMLVFATTIIGLCIDYVFHACIAASHGEKSWRAIVPALWLGGITTIAGYILLTFLALPLLQQLGVFMAAALATVLTLVVYCVPRFQLNTPTHPNWGRLHHQLARGYARLHQFRPQYWLPLVAIVVGLIMNSQFVANDSVRQLASSPPNLVQQEQQIRRVTATHFDADVLLIHGNSAEVMLQRYAAVANLLPQWQAQGLITRWQSFFDYVQPPQQQHELQQLQHQLWQTSAGADYLHWLGITVPVQPEAQPWSALLNHPLASLFVYPESTKGYLGVIRLSGVQPELTSYIQEIAHAEHFNPLTQASSALGQYRVQLQWWLIALIGLAWVVLALRIKSQASLAQRIALSTQVISIIIIALGGALSLALVAQSLNVFHFVGAILVVVLGLDYGIFCASNVHREHVLQALSLSALTTAIAFGVLSFSSTPAIAAFGHVVLWGVLFSALLTPLITNKK
ncbi:MAG: hypothetical protein B7X54_04330 [Idiomarina sp. 34-48-12]|nr:MAG: hypothetical protein B7X54_04330 [Idiomarina sp. 34-48-12]